MRVRTTKDRFVGRGVVDLISRLRDLDGQLPLREQRVADFVTANLEQISGMTIGALASNCGVSSPTVVRFCRTMGCDGYRDFKIRLAQNIAVSQQYLGADAHAHAAGALGIFDEILGAISATLGLVRGQLDPEVFEAAIDALVDARTVLIGGVGGGSSMLAAESANRLFRLGIHAIAVSDSYMLQMHAATLQKGDVLLLISASGEAEEILSAAEIASGYGATTLAITKTGSKLARDATVALNVELQENPDVLKPTASRYGYLLIVDALAMAVALKRSNATTENLRRIRASLTAYHGRTGPQPLGD